MRNAAVPGAARIPWSRSAWLRAAITGDGFDPDVFSANALLSKV